MPFDAAEYLEYVDDLDVGEERKLDLIHVVAAIMHSFVDRAFGTAPEQTLLGIAPEYSGAKIGDPVASRGIITSTFNDAGSE